MQRQRALYLVPTMNGLDTSNEPSRSISSVRIRTGNPQESSHAIAPGSLATRGGSPSRPHWYDCACTFSVLAFITRVQVIRYDDGPELVLSEVRDLEHYLHQNSSEDIMRKRQVRMALRALDGQIVRWSYDHVQVCPRSHTVLSEFP